MNNYNHNNPMEDVYTTFKRVAAFLLGMASLLISIWFSAEGTNFNLKDSFIFGIVVALMVTVFELIFDEDGFKGSLFIAFLGICAYVYGVFSNYYGIWVRQGQPEAIELKAFAGILALFIEVAPEQLILWSLGLTGRGVRDLLSNFFGNNFIGNFRGKSNYSGESQNTNPGEKSNSFNPSQRNFERIKKENQQGKKKKGKWVAGMPGRPPKDSRLDKLLGGEINKE